MSPGIHQLERRVTHKDFTSFNDSPGGAIEETSTAPPGLNANMRSLLALAIAILATLSTYAQTITVHPREDPRAILHNPDMGWVLYENYPIDTDANGSSTLLPFPRENFPEVDQVAVMFSWADVEKTPEHYDFSKVDFAYDHWAMRDKSIQLRMSADTLLWWNNRTPPSGLGVPPYVLDKLPADKKQIRNCEGVNYTVVDAREPYYLERLARFLTAVEKHFDKSRPVSLIDLRGFGLWGEWHTGYRYPTLEDRHAALVGILDCWSKNLPSHFLALSYSHDPDSPKSYYAGPYKTFDEKFTDTYTAFLQYSAFDHALTLPNVTLRRDGVGGAVFSNQRKLNEIAFGMLKGPMSCEFLGGFGANKKGGRAWIDWMIDDALSLHPNYIALLGWQGGDALDFIRERPDLVEKGITTMGYRLVPTEIKYPAAIRADKKFPVEMIWVNRGVGRAMRDYSMVLSLVDKDGKTIARADAAELPMHAWVKGRDCPCAVSAAFKQTAVGDYDLFLTLLDPKDGKAIALPLAEGKDRSYRIGGIRMTADAK